MLKVTSFRVQNYMNIEDSDWIPVERVTSFVGRNESGKTALLKALHKFNPAISEKYNPQREFPRDRYSKDYENGSDWPVCSVCFEIDESLKKKFELNSGDNIPSKVTCTKYYDENIMIEFDPPVSDEPLKTDSLVSAFKNFSSTIRRIEKPENEEDEKFQNYKTAILDWITAWNEKFASIHNLQCEEGVDLLKKLRKESEKYAKPYTADYIEELQNVIDETCETASAEPLIKKLNNIIINHLPVFIYFENYGILNSAIYLPRFLEDLKREPNAPSTRTINSMFKHVRLSVEEIFELGKESAQNVINKGQQVTQEIIAQDQQKKESRSIKLNSASLDISKRFNDWFGQRRHSIEYQADGDYFRIWVADDKRPGVKIELESRSKGFQWFFSFYLVFLVESKEGHKDAVLLLDEPGLHLHPTAQQELIAFFEKLSEGNQLIYTTHSPFLIDGEHIHRVRPVTEDNEGHSRVSIDSWPEDRETIFPLQAAAGYAMVKGLFRHKKNVLVEGMSDYYYLYALSQQCSETNRTSLPDDVYITPCGGTKLVGNLASLFLGQKVRPLILLDGDDAGRVRRESLLKELYSEHESSILMLDDLLNMAGSEIEIEDVLGEDIILPAISAFIGEDLKLNEKDRKAGGVINCIKSAASRKSIQLPKGWKASIAAKLVSEWVEKSIKLPDSVLEKASTLFEEINKRFK